MDLSLEVRGLRSSSELKDFARVQVAFATWYAQDPCRRARVLLTRQGSGGFRCGIQAWLRGLRPVEAGATGGSPWEAVQEASNLLEVACFERIRERHEDAARRPGARAAA